MRRIVISFTAVFSIILMLATACTPTPAGPENDVAQTQDNQESTNEDPDTQNSTNPANNEDPQGSEDNPQNTTDPGNGNDDTQSQDNEAAIAPIPVLAPSLGTEIDTINLSDTEAEYNKAANGFALSLLSKLYDGKAFVASPLSIQMALSLAANGASGQTLQEIIDALGFSTLGLEGMNSYSKSLMEQLPAVDFSVKIQLANAMIARKEIPVRASYKEQIESYFYAPVENMSFSNPVKVREVVNDWCSRNTNGLIPSILDEDCNSSTLAYLLNALYFKAAWLNPFDPKYDVVKKQVFKTGSGSVNLDYLISRENLDYADKGTYRIALRPLGEKGLYDIAILLPKEDNGLDALIKTMPLLDWGELVASCANTDVALRLPAFETNSSFDLVSRLKELGITKAFMDGAEFDIMFDNVTACISSVLHKARIILGDGGVEAASVTSVEMADTSNMDDHSDSSQPIQFFADHPFVYLIAESSSGTILFGGVFNGN